MTLSPEKVETRRSRPWQVLLVHVVAWALVAGCVASAAALVLLGSVESRPSALEERLRSDATSGAVTTLQVQQPFGNHSRFDPTDGVWSAVVAVRWRDGPFWRHTEYVVASTERRARRVAARRGCRCPVAVGQPDALPRKWTDLQPAIEVEPTRRSHFSGGTVSVFGVEWSGPSWALQVGLVVGAVALIWNLIGPQPWRFSRWGWTWLMLGAWPVGVPAFLLFGGASGLLPPTERARRLSGWSGFGLSIVAAFVCGALLA